MFNLFKQRSIQVVLNEAIKDAQLRFLRAQHNLHHYQAQVESEKNVLEKLHQQSQNIETTGRLDGGMPPLSLAENLIPRIRRRSSPVPGAGPNLDGILGGKDSP